MARKTAAQESRLGSDRPAVSAAEESSLGAGFRSSSSESVLAQERRERDLARALTQIGDQKAQATSAYRRVCVREATDDGRYVVSYRGQDITVSAGAYRGRFWPDQWVLIGLVEGTLEITAPSAYGAGPAP